MYKCINGWTKEKMKAQIALKNNGKKSQADEGACLYRSDGGNACAVGCFIPDEKYSKDMDNMDNQVNHDGTDVTSLLKREPELMQLMPLEVGALRKLQYVHDQYFDNCVKSLHKTLFDWIDLNVED